MLCAIRLRGEVGLRKGEKSALQRAGLKRVNSSVVLEDTPENRGTLRSVDHLTAWGEIPEDMDVPARLHPPRGGLRSSKLHQPEGDLGYRKDMPALIKRMMPEKG